jgi:hypothetical protein
MYRRLKSGMMMMMTTFLYKTSLKHHAKSMVNWHARSWMLLILIFIAPVYS